MSRHWMNRRRGFTLIELMVAVVVLGGLLSASYACLMAGYRSQKTVEKRSDLLQKGRVTLRIIARDLRHASPTGGSIEFVGIDRRVGAFQGDNLDFQTHLFSPRYPGERDLCEVSYYVETDPLAGTLNLYRRRDSTPDSEPFAGGSRELIARGLVHFQLEYYDGYDWVHAWGGEEDGPNTVLGPLASNRQALGEDGPPPGGYLPGQSGLPEAVRVSIAFAVGSSEEAAARLRRRVRERENAARDAAEDGDPRRFWDDEELDSSEETADERAQLPLFLQLVVRLTLTQRVRSGGSVLGEGFDQVPGDGDLEDIELNTMVEPNGGGG